MPAIYILLEKKWTYFEQLIEIWRYLLLKVVGLFVKSRQDMKKWLFWRPGAGEKPLYLHILCSILLCLWRNLGRTFFSLAYTKFCAWSSKLAALTSSSAPFFIVTSTVYIPGSVTIHLLGINTESAEFRPNYLLILGIFKNDI